MQRTRPGRPLACLHAARVDSRLFFTLDMLMRIQQITMRRAGAADQKALEALQWRASLGNPGDREALLANPDAIDLPLQQIEGGHVFVAEVAGSIKGFAAILPRPDGNSELDALFVEPACWRQGIGRQLVEYCCSEAKNAGAAELHVVGNPHAEGFYASSGFKNMGTKTMQFGVGLLMKRVLSWDRTGPGKPAQARPLKRQEEYGHRLAEE